jgi:chromosome segregation ATPase
MGFLDSIFGKKEVEVRVERFNFPELGEWIEKHKSEIGGGYDEGAQMQVERIPDVISEIGAVLEGLGSSEVHKDVPQRVKSTVESSKDNYISKLRKELDSVSTENPMKASESLNSSLASIRDLYGKYGSRVKFGFPGELSELRKKLNDLIGISNELNTALEGRKGKTKSLKRVEKDYKKAKKIESGISEAEGKKDSAKNEMKELEAEREKKEKEADRLEKSDRAEKLASMQAELKGLKERKQELENYVLNVLGPLKRVFKKYAKAVKEGKASGINVSKYAEDPVDTYFWGEHTLPDLLAKIQKSIQTGVLDLDKSEGEKAVKKIRNINFSYLEKTRSEYNAATSRIRSLEMKIKNTSLEKELERKAREIKSLDSKKEALGKRIEKIESEIEDSKIRLNDAKSKLEKSVSDFIGGRAEII